MSKVYTYMVIAVGLTFLLKFAGLPAGGDAFISWMGLSGDASGIELGNFIKGIIALFVVGSGAGIAIGFLTKSSPESYLVAPIASGIFTIFIGTFVSIINYAADFGWVYYVIYLIFVPLMIGFGISIIQFWRGVD